VMAGRRGSWYTELWWGRFCCCAPLSCRRHVAMAYNVGCAPLVKALHHEVGALLLASSTLTAYLPISGAVLTY
jgi:hypothetical protein